MNVKRKTRLRTASAALAGLAAGGACGESAGFVVPADESVAELVDTVVVEPEEFRATEIGEVVQFTATPVDVSGFAVDEATVEWSSSDPGVATVTQSGVATAYRDGQAEIRARAGDATGTATLTVSQQLNPPPR